MSEIRESPSAVETRCSFCGLVVRHDPRIGSQVVLGANGVAICKDCVALCVEIFTENESNRR